jgi:hypothetical protein
MSGYRSLEDPAFDRAVTLRDAYRVMERFVSEYLGRGDTPVLDFYTYFWTRLDGESSDPAALDDFLKAATDVLDSTES